MNATRPLAVRLLLVAGAAFALAACGKLNAESYDKIKMAMEYKDVTAAIGSPASCSDTAGFKVCQWGDEKSGATIRFAAGKVVMHTSNNLK